jgi:hypothetical protein
MIRLHLHQPCVCLLKLHGRKEQQLGSHLKTTSCEVSFYECAFAKDMISGNRRGLTPNSTRLSRQCPTFAKKGFKMSQFCLKLHALWCIAKGNTKRRFWEAVTLQWQEPGWAFLWCIYCSNAIAQNGLGTKHRSGTLRKFQATIHRQGFINPR